AEAVSAWKRPESGLPRSATPAAASRTNSRAATRVMAIVALRQRSCSIARSGFGAGRVLPLRSAPSVLDSRVPLAAASDIPPRPDRVLRGPGGARRRLRVVDPAPPGGPARSQGRQLLPRRRRLAGDVVVLDARPHRCCSR